MTDVGMVLVALGVTAVICLVTFFIEEYCARSGRIPVESAVSVFGGVCVVAGLLVPIVVYYLVFKSGITVYGTHNSIAVLFFGALITFFLAQGIAKIGEKRIRLVKREPKGPE